MRTEAYSGPRQTFKLELFAKIVNGWELLTIFAKSFILSIWRSFDYAYREIFSIVPKVVDQQLLIDMQAFFILFKFRPLNMLLKIF